MELHSSAAVSSSAHSPAQLAAREQKTSILMECTVLNNTAVYHESPFTSEGQITSAHYSSRLMGP